MKAGDLKKELVALIEGTNDEELLSLLKEDFIFYGKSLSTDITDNLSKEQMEDLKRLAEEDELKDTHNHDAFIKATDKWRLK